MNTCPACRRRLRRQAKLQRVILKGFAYLFALLVIGAILYLPFVFVGVVGIALGIFPAFFAGCFLVEVIEDIFSFNQALLRAMEKAGGGNCTKATVDYRPGKG